MEALGKLLSPLSMGTSAVQDTVKLVVIGGTVETARRISGSAWSNFVDFSFALFTELMPVSEGLEVVT